MAALARYVTSPLALVATVLRLRPDIVHLNTSIEEKSFWRDAVYLLVAKMLRRHVVYQVHGGMLPQQLFPRSRMLTALLRRILQASDAVVLLARVEEDAYCGFARFQRLQVIPNAVELTPYRTFEKSFDDDPLRLLYMGRLADDKGVLEAIRALGVLSEREIINVCLEIAGSGPFEKALRGEVRRLGLEARVYFSGPLFGGNKLECWRRAQVFVFPTFHREGLPYTVLESLASGTPVITTRVGAIPDVVQDGVQGILLRSHDPVTVADAIQEFLEDRARLARMSRAAVSRAESEYSVDRLALQFTRLYQEVMA